MQPSSGETSKASSVVLIVLFVVYAGALVLLMADLGWTALHQKLSHYQAVLLIAVAVLLAVSAVLVIPPIRRGRTPAYAWNFLLVAVAIILSLGVAEIALRAFFVIAQRNQPYGPRTPKVHYSTMIDARIIPGVTGETHFTVNEQGMRAPSIKLLSEHPNPYQIVTVGGSTTQCGLLDDQNEWPHLLMQDLNGAQQRRFVFVSNMGVDGQTTLDHLAFLHYYRGPAEADLLTFLIGANDFTATLAFRGKAADHAMRERSLLATQESPLPYPFYSHTRVFRAISTLRARTGILESPGTADWVQTRRDLRAKFPRVALPDLRIGLQEYRSHVLELAAFCNEHRKRCVFLTQPSIYRPDLTPAEDRLLWLGFLGPAEHIDGFVPPADLARAIGEFNQTLLTVCRESGLECYDTAAALPHSAEAFYDDYHMNNRGAELFARFLAGKLADSVANSE